jgi:hypothetical protein
VVLEGPGRVSGTEPEGRGADPMPTQAHKGRNRNRPLMYWADWKGGSWLATAGASAGAARGQRLKPEGLVRGEEEGRVLQMHVGTSGPSMALAALEVHDLLGDSSRDGGGEAALAGRNAGEVRRVAPAVSCHAADRVPYHLGRHGSRGGVVCGARAQDEAREDGC